MQMRQTGLGYSIAVWLLVGGWACDDDTPGGAGGGDTAGADGATDAPRDTADASDAEADSSADTADVTEETGGDADGGQTTTCDNTQQCPEGQVCHPQDGVCTADEVECSEHTECAPASFCGEALQCIPSEAGSPCAGDDNCIDGETCTAGTCGCGGELFTAEAVPPNMLIVLDRSGSMDEEIGGDSKWEIALDAIADILTEHGDEIRFGLMLFPGEDIPCDEGFECGPGVVFVDPAEGTAGDINDDLGDAGRCAFSTPIGAALEELVDYDPLEDTGRNNYVLLITDGQDNCEDSDPTGAAADLLAESPSIRTYVVGFGSGVDEDQLEELADSGGTATPEVPYYQADDAAALAEALSVIAGSALGCSYALSETPADPELIFVYFGADESTVDEDDLVDRDEGHAEGWDYDEGGNRIEFYGEACRQLREGEVPGLVISYGCALGPKD